MTGVSLSFNNAESLRKFGIKIVGTDFDISCEGKSNSSAPVSTSSVLTLCVSVTVSYIYYFLIVNKRMNSAVKELLSYIFKGDSFYYLLINTVNVSSIVLLKYLQYC